MPERHLFIISTRAWSKKIKSIVNYEDMQPSRRSGCENSNGGFFKIHISFYYGDMLNNWESLIWYVMADGSWFMSFSYLMKQKTWNI